MRHDSFALNVAFFSYSFSAALGYDWKVNANQTAIDGLNLWPALMSGGNTR